MSSGLEDVFCHPKIYPRFVLPVSEWQVWEGQTAAKSPPPRPRARVHRAKRIRKRSSEHLSKLYSRRSPVPGPSQQHITFDLPPTPPSSREGSRSSNNVTPAAHRRPTPAPLTLTTFPPPSFDKSRHSINWSPTKAVSSFFSTIKRSVSKVTSTSTSASSSSESSSPVNGEGRYELQGCERHGSTENLKALDSPSNLTGRQGYDKTPPFWPENWRTDSDEFGWDRRHQLFVRDGVVE